MQTTRNLIIMLLLCSALQWASAGTGIRLGENFRIYPSAITQTETFITRHPGNASVLFASANTIDLSTGFISEGIYVTTDAGATWSGSDTCTGAPITFHRGDPGIAIDRDGRFLLIRLGTIPGLFSHFSTDNGRTWSSQRTVATDDQDRATLMSDGDVSSPYYGRSYALWVKFAPPYPVLVSYSDNGGSSWTAPAQINAPPQRCQGGEIVPGTAGSVNAVWASVIGVSPFTEDYAGFARSTNGGVNWTVDENAFDMNGIAGTFPAKNNIRVNGLPRMDIDRSGGVRTGWIYVVSTEKNLAPAGTDPDIIFHRSTDNGSTWSGGIRVNQDAVNNGKFQYFPAIHVDDGGGINVLYYDDRSTAADSAGVFLSRSTDGGFTWSDYEVADHHFRPTPIGGLLGQGYQGDNIGMTSIGDTLWPVWMDNSSGIYQVWTCPIDLTTLGTSVEEDMEPDDFILHQNFPNPFNPSTRISFNLRKRESVDLSVFDLLGRKIATMASGMFEPGGYEEDFDASGLASGTYLYRLRTGTGTVTKRMIVVK
jgi:hypothetical protein